MWHWLNALCFVLLILTGLDLNYKLFGISRVPHEWIGLTLTANYIFWLAYHLYSDQISVYQPSLNVKDYLTRAWLQVRYYSYGIFKKERNPHQSRYRAKFNPLQQILYPIIMLVLVPIQIMTGLILWNKPYFMDWIKYFGYKTIVHTHEYLFFFFIGFIFIHIFLSALGKTPTQHFKAMVTGYDEEDRYEP